MTMAEFFVALATAGALAFVLCLIHVVLNRQQIALQAEEALTAAAVGVVDAQFRELERVHRAWDETVLAEINPQRADSQLSRRDGQRRGYSHHPVTREPTPYNTIQNRQAELTRKAMEGSVWSTDPVSGERRQPAIVAWTPEERHALGIEDNEKFIRETDTILNTIEWESL